MQRRHFIKISGISLSSLLFTDLASAHTTAALINLPGKVFIRLTDGVHELASSDKSKWTYKDVTVDLKHSDQLKISAQSPSEALYYVQLQWNYPQKAASKYLADHWERTYGDVNWQKPSADQKMPWYFIQHNDNQTNCFGIKTGSSTIAHWNVNSNNLQLTLDTQSGGEGVQLGARTLHAADIVTTKNIPGESVFATVQRFCKIMCEKARLPKQPVYGINDWYFTYGNNSAPLILELTALMADLVTDNNNRPFSVVDDGWGAYSSTLPGKCCRQDDYSRPNDKFKDMQKLAGDIKNLGMRPGLWTRPLIARHDDKATLLLPSIPGRNDPERGALDPSIDENIERVKRNISLYKQWGYEMVKHDYSTYDIAGRWGFDMKKDFTSAGWKFNDNTKTTAEIILNLYKAIREAAADMYLIGCNTLSHLSAGLFEFNRIGDDTSGKEWDRTRKMGVNTLGFRMPQHRTFYDADGDCVGLTKDVPWQKNKQWMQLLAESGSPLFISPQPAALRAEQKQFIKQSFATAAKTLPIGEPLDWMETALPEKWKLNGRIVTFDWS